MFIKFPDSYRLKPELKIVTAKTNAAKVNNTKIEKLLAEKTVITSIGNFIMRFPTQFGRYSKANRPPFQSKSATVPKQIGHPLNRGLADQPGSGFLAAA
jgi:hypothetical protein